MNILLYNYVQPNELGSAGGGVAVYIKNLTQSLRASGHRVYTLSGGDRYNIFSRKVRLVRKGEDEFVIYNSPVVAPAIFSFYHPEYFLYDSALNDIARKLMHEIGPIDVFHFHNIEGLTFSFFASLRNCFDRSALIYSAHNYNIICPQVNLWKNGCMPCGDYEDGAACVACSNFGDNRTKKIFINTLKTVIKDMKSEGIFRLACRFDSLAKKMMSNKKRTIDLALENQRVRVGNGGNLYGAYRATGINLINFIFDKTLAVSNRTAQILLENGASADKVGVSYIGTAHYERARGSKRKYATPENIHIAYLGYMRSDKGFYLFIEMLDKLPQRIKRHINVTIAARIVDALALEKMHKMSSAFKGFNIFNGYTHDNLGEILSPVNLGVVPVLWEDNLPQVAIEFVAHGVPVIVSNRGGAQEIAGNADFIFDVNEPDSLMRKICSIVDGNMNVKTFWDGSINIRSNVEHAQELISIYQKVLENRCCGK